MHAEYYMQRMIRKKGIMSFFLWLLSLLYARAIALKNWAYDHHLLPVKKTSAVVISIGNIVAGGVGKTPLVHFLASQLSAHYKVAILSRGYHSLAEKRSVSTRVHLDMSADLVGDEALLLAKKLPHVQVWVGKHRYDSAQKAVSQGADILILDDGFQHRKLYRDFEVVVVSAHKTFDNGYFLPRGYLRDFPSRLQRADVLAIMGRPLQPFSYPSSVVFTRKIQEDLQGKKVVIFCAIANPDRFVLQIKAAKAEIVATVFKPDHALFSYEEIKEIYDLYMPDILICTEKDEVKLTAACAALPIRAIPLIVHLCAGQDVWDHFIHQIQLQVDHVRRISRCTP